MTIDEWLARFGVEWPAFQRTLLLGVDGLSPKLEVVVRSAWVVGVTVNGPARRDGALDFKVTFDITVSETERNIGTLIVHAFGDLPIPTRDLTARILCNVIALAEMLRLRDVTSAPRPANSMGYLRAGFLPIQGSWDNSRATMGTLLRAPGFAKGESGAVAGIATILASSEPRSIRALLPNAGAHPQAGVIWPATSAALLGGMSSWYGRLDILDVETSGFRRAFCHGYRA